MVTARRTVGTAGSSAPAGRRAPASASGFKFTYKPRSPEAVRERATRAVSGRDSYVNTDVIFFTPAERSNTVRILPPPPDANWQHYGVSVAAHYDIGVDNSAYLCLAKMQNQPCPVCEERERANAAEETDLAKALRQRYQVLVWVIDRSQESKGPMLWNMSGNQDKDITKLVIDPSDGAVLPVDDPYEGYDLTFTRVGSGLKTKYSGWVFSRRATQIHEDPATTERWLKYIVDHPIDKQLVYRDYDYIQKVLNGQPAGDSNNDDEKQEQIQQQEQQQEQQQTGATGAAAEPPATGRRRPILAPAEITHTPAVVADEGDDKPTWAELVALKDNELFDLADGFQIGEELDKHAATLPGGQFPSLKAAQEWVAAKLGIVDPDAVPPQAAAPADRKPSWKAKLGTGGK